MADAEMDSAKRQRLDIYQRNHGRKKLAKLRESSRVEMFETPEGYLARLLKRDGVKVIGIAEQHLAQAIVNTFTDGTPSDGGR